MALRKNKGANVRRNYSLYVQLGLIISLSLLITAFKVDYIPESEFVVEAADQPLIKVDEMNVTRQDKKPPPPPKPPIPVPVSDDETLEVEQLDLDVSLDIEEEFYISELPEIEDKEEERSEPFTIVEKMPEPIGGIAGILKRITYPEIAKKAGIEGRVYIEFVVDVDGNVTNPVVVKPIGGGCDEVALEAIKATKFEPGMQRGKPVPVRMTLPVQFSLR